MHKAERIQSPAAARILGLNLRTLQNLAGRGEIPSAAKIGRCWTYDEMVLRHWLKKKEGEIACRTISIDEQRFGGGESSMQAGNIVEAYERAIGLRPKSGSQSGSRR